MIYCIGDSHASFFTGKDEMVDIWPHVEKNTGPYFNGIRIGPMSAHNLLSNKNRIIDITNKVGDWKEDYLMLPHGDSDCRYEIPRLLEAGWDAVCDAVDESVDGYCKAISFFNERFSLIIWGVIGAGPPSIYSYGTQEERNGIVMMFNEKVKDFCEKNAIPFVTIYDDMVENFITKNGWLIDEIHLGQTAMPLVIEKFRSAGLV